MTLNSVEKPIINSPYDEPTQYWKIKAHEKAKLIKERRKATYYYTPDGRPDEEGNRTQELEIPQVDMIRERLTQWRQLALRGEGGVTRVTAELLNYWRRDGRKEPLFFAQLEAAETIIFLTEARADLLQGIDIPLDEPGEDKAKDGFKAFSRLCCKMATGAGKTTVMAMLAAWSILNKVNSKNDSRFSSAVLVVCPNVTIRNRLAELDPKKGEASIYRSRDLVPLSFMPQLKQGKVLTVNWHVFEPKTSERKMLKMGRRVTVVETVHIGKKQKARDKRYMTETDLRRKAALGQLKLLKEYRDESDVLQKADVQSDKYVETDTALVRRVLGRELGEKQNILVFNDEAHHAYRLHHQPEQGDTDSAGADLLGDTGDVDYYYKEATVWVDGLDRVHKLRGINKCIDFSATPYYLGKAGEKTSRIFEWTVSNFGLHDAIEAGLVKVPQLAARDNSGENVPEYFNIWKWLLGKLTSSERGAKKSEAKPAAVLKYAHTPIAMMGGMWETLRQEWATTDEKRPPVFIIVCKTTNLAKMVFDWLADNKRPEGIPEAMLPELRNQEGVINTVRIDSKVQHELDSGHAKNDESRWMRFLLDTVGRQEWHKDSQGNKIYPPDFEALAKKLNREQFLDYPPGRDIRCIVSVGMLTEGWDCNTVTHIVGLRPFMSQLLCEQVIGRGLRRASYEVGEDGLMSEEVAMVLGVPLSLYPIKGSGGGGSKKRKERHHIYADDKKAEYAITFPRVEGYRQFVRNTIVCDVNRVPKVTINNRQIPQEVEMTAALPDNEGRVRLGAPGSITEATLEDFRGRMRLQNRVFEMAHALLQHYADGSAYTAPANVLYARLCVIVNDYINKRVQLTAGADIKDAFMAPYYGYIIQKLHEGIKADTAEGEMPELPRYESMRPPGTTAEVNFYTKIEPYDVKKCHLNAIVADNKLEKEVARILDNSDKVQAFVKNEGLGFAIQYHYDGEDRDYLPDFLVRLQNKEMLILEPKGYDEAKDEKKKAAERWVRAVNADKKYGKWHYRMISGSAELPPILEECCGQKAA